ncbi:glycosyltransferase family 4 protein [Patescibacteria group bacterium]
MKLLFVTEYFPENKNLKFTGGVEARTYYIINNLAKKHEITVLCKKTSFFKQPKLVDGVKVIPCGFNSKTVEVSFISLFERMAFMIAAFLKGYNLNFDLVEGSNFVSFLPAFFIGKLKRKSVVSWWPDVLADSWFGYFGITGLFGQLIEKISLKLPWTKVIALSQATKKKLIKNGVKENKIDVVYGGVDIKKLTVSNLESIKKEKNIICISRLVKYKRVEDLILAFSKLEKKLPKFNLLIIGTGPEEKKLKYLVKAKKIDNKVEFRKNISRNKLYNLLKKAYIFCLPSVIEGFGLVTIEAAALGTPFIVTNIEVNKEVTKNGMGGIFFKKENFQDLENKIKILINNKDLYRQKQKQGLKLAKYYEWKKIASKTESVYLNILK